MRGVYNASQRAATADSIRIALFGNQGVHGGSELEALERGEYRDVLSLVRVLVSGPTSKFEVDCLVDR